MKKKTRLNKLLKAAESLESVEVEKYSCNAVQNYVSKRESKKYDKMTGATYHSHSGFTFDERREMTITERQLARQLVVLMYREMIKQGVVK